MVAAELSVGELARRSGVAVSALHFYEQRGLISSRRTAGNQRRYVRPMLRRIAVIKVAGRLGIPLAVLARAFAALPADTAPRAEDWRELTEVWRSELDNRIDQLRRLRDDLDGCIGCGCLSMTRCSLVNAEDHLGRSGPGARTLDNQLF